MSWNRWVFGNHCHTKRWMYKHLSNGCMYDATRQLYIEFDQTKPQPHNRKQTLLFYLHVRKIADLTAEELTYLLQESRRAQPPDVKQQKWYKDLDHKRHREHMIHRLKHDYWWAVCSKIQYKYTKEQLDNMPWTEARHKKHERVFGPTLWEWVKKARPNQYHALWGHQNANNKRKTKKIRKVQR